MQDTEAAAWPTAVLWLLHIRCRLTTLHFSTLQWSGSQGQLALICIATKIITQCGDCRLEGRLLLLLLLFLAKSNPMFEWLFVSPQTAEWFLANGSSHQGPFFFWNCSCSFKILKRRCQMFMNKVITTVNMVLQSQQLNAVTTLNLNFKFYHYSRIFRMLQW